MKLGSVIRHPFKALKRAWCAVFHVDHWRDEEYRTRPNTNDHASRLRCPICGFDEPLESYR